MCSYRQVPCLPVAGRSLLCESGGSELDIQLAKLASFCGVYMSCREALEKE